MIIIRLGLYALFSFIGLVLIYVTQIKLFKLSTTTIGLEECIASSIGHIYLIPRLEPERNPRFQMLQIALPSLLNWCLTYHRTLCQFLVSCQFLRNIFKCLRIT